MSSKPDAGATVRRKFSSSTAMLNKALRLTAVYLVISFNHLKFADDIGSILQVG